MRITYFFQIVYSAFGSKVLLRFARIYPFNFRPPFFVFAAYFDIHFRDGRNQPLCINMQRITVNIFPRTGFHKAAAVHNVDIVAHVLDNAEINK